MGLFNNRKSENGRNFVPVWFMRQAGRYHKHYQNIRKDHDFMSMCKNSDLACEITMGPIEDFNFDAAILFSDLLFPLEQMNLGLSYKSGPPTLETTLDSLEKVKNIKLIEKASTFYNFQKEAVEKLKVALPKDKTLLGFVGAPFTLYTYAVEGAHKGNLISSKQGLYDGRYEKFFETLFPELIENMYVQAQGGADAICLFDTAAGELCLKDYKNFIIPTINKITATFKKQFPNTKIVYYSKLTHLDYLRELEDDNIDVLGIDWRHSLPKVLKEFGSDYYIQGNIDPVWLHLPWNHLENNLNELWNEMSNSNLDLSKWIFGLGHGVLQHTPEENVKNTVSLIQSKFNY